MESGISARARPGRFIKVCGVTSASQAQAVSALGPDAVGFIFWARSRRAVCPKDAGGWETAPGVLRIGVFVDPELAEVEAAREAARLDGVQLHGGETPEFCRAVGSRVWKALHDDDQTPGRAAAYPVDAVLLDTRVGALPGGTGQTGDWDRAAALVRGTRVPVILAGGLGPGNLGNAIRRVNPWGVDVNSGVEVSPGMKNLHQVEEAIAICRAS